MTGLTHTGLLNTTLIARQSTRKVRKVLSKAERLDRFIIWMDRFFASDAEAARSFGVTERTIRNWSNGVTRPGYLEAVHALTLDPRAVPYLTGVSDEL